MDKRISVIIPIYNAEKYLKQTLDSIRFQTYRNLEIICVLDSPTDNSSAIVDETAKEDERIKPIRLHENAGPAAARNAGVQNASGEYMHFMDSDDLINQHFYKSMIDAITATNADVAVCSAFYEKKPKQSIWLWANEVLLGSDKIQKTNVTIHGWSWRYLIKRDFWNNHNLLFPDFGIMEDIAVMIPMIYYANKVTLCPDAVYFYKNRENSIVNGVNCSKTRKILLKEHMRNAKKIIKSFMCIHNIKRHGKLYRYRNKRAGKTICINDPITYGKFDKKISVILPVYNAEKYLKQTLDSLRFQTYKNLEIICVLDSPTDNSETIVENALKEDSRIIIVRHSQNMGLPTARNTGIRNASGEYMHFIDSDDLISPDFYDVMMNGAVNADADIAACSVFYEKKPWRSIWFPQSEVLSGSAKIEKTEAALLGWSWRYLIRRSFWNNLDFSFPDLVPMEDMPVMIPMIFHANKVVLCPNAVYFYKHRKNSILNDDNQAQLKLHSENRRKARKIFRDFMRANGIKRPSRLIYYIKKRFA
jgi:glycosyltransferase involved in cell wall biosynthesis